MVGARHAAMQRERAEAGLRKQKDSGAPDPTRVTIEANPISAFHLLSPRWSATYKGSEAEILPKWDNPSRKSFGKRWFPVSRCHIFRGLRHIVLRLSPHKSKIKMSAPKNSSRFLYMRYFLKREVQMSCIITGFYTLRLTAS